MKRITIVHAVLIALALCLPAAPAQALNGRSWVASNGSGSTCSRAAPCLTFQDAHNATSPGGEINCVDAGDYQPLTITKSISIVCDNTEASILVAGGNGVVINAGPATAITVTLTGLDIDTVGTGAANAGIVFNSGAALHVSKVKIRNVAAFGSDASGISFQPNGAAELYVTDSIITSNGGTGSLSGGIVISPTGSGSAYASINAVRLENNSTGIVVDGTHSSGVAVNATIVNSVVAGSQHDGVLAQAGTAQVTVSLDHTQVAGNGVGVTSLNGAAVILNNTIVQTNNTGLNASGGAIFSYGNNPINGNQPGGIGTAPIVIGLH
jgi:hypothetical protein